MLPRTGHDPNSPFALRSAKIATIVFAALQIVVGISGLGGAEAVVNQVLAIQGLTLGMILGLFALSLGKNRSANASLCGLVGGLLATIAVVFVPPMIKFEDGSTLAIGWPWKGLITCLATLVTGRLAQLVFASSRGQ